MRAVMEVSETGNLIVPPAALDSVLIITHKAFNQGAILKKAIDWVMNMHDMLEALPTVQSLMDGNQVKQHKKVEDDILLPKKTKIAIAAILGGGGSEVEGWPEGGSEGDIETIFGGDNPKLKEKIKKWVELVRTDPAKARRHLGFDKHLARNVAVIRETFKRQPTDDELQGYLRVHHPELAGCDLNVGAQRTFAMKMYLEHMKRFETTIESERNIDQIKKKIQGLVFSKLGNHYREDKNQSYCNPFSLVGRAVKDILGTKDKVAIGSRFDRPQVHALLMNPEIEQQIVDWVCGRLIDSGQCPALNELKGEYVNGSLLDEDAA
jgi:hypothetical protein